MRRIIVSVAVVVALVIPVLPSAARVLSDEGCEAQNPLSPTCSYTVTHTSATPFTGAGGIGDWFVIVTRGDETIKFKSLADGRPTFREISFKIGDEVKAKALSPGSGLTVGHFDP
jgi:hypothetical protein